MCESVFGDLVTREQGIRLESIQSERLTERRVCEDASAEELNRERLARGGRQVAALGAQSLFDIWRQADGNIRRPSAPRAARPLSNRMSLLFARSKANTRRKRRSTAAECDEPCGLDR